MSEANKRALQQEMRLCLKDLKYYQSEQLRAKSEGNETYVQSCEREIEKARRQYNVAKTEYVDKYGPSGVPT